MHEAKTHLSRLVDAAAGMGGFRLIGIGASDLAGAAQADPPDLLDPDLARRKRVEAAIDAVRAKLGRQAIAKGRALDAKPVDV